MVTSHQHVFNIHSPEVRTLSANAPLLTPPFAGQTALHKAILDTDEPLDQVMGLVLHGVDVDMMDEEGNTALHCLVKLPAKKGVS